MYDQTPIGLDDRLESVTKKVKYICLMIIIVSYIGNDEDDRKQ